MKDQDNANEIWIAGQWEDFDQFLAEKNYEACEAIMTETGGKGWENDAIRMHQLLNKAEGGYTYEPIEDSEIPFITPEEDDEQVVGVFPDVRNPQDRADKI